jgi:UDP-glucose 4-epimerase
MPKQSHILVTGSAGHLGEALMRTFRAAGRPAIGLDIKPSPYTDRVGSICDRVLVKECMAGAHAVLHAATLHKPHVATHTKQEFVDTNISGTLTLLEEAVANKIQSLIYTSTTSAFGAALTQAGWITEEVVPVPKNIYGTTKVAAESLCELFAREKRLPVLILRTSRFFPEDDDDAATRSQYGTANLQANELLYRRADIQDIVDAQLLAIEKAPAIGFRRYIISATTPFQREHLQALHQNAPQVVATLFPEYEELYQLRGWTMFPHIDRVYVNDLARAELSWRPKYDFRHVLSCLQNNTDFRSELARAVGKKAYHDTPFAHGPYPVA